MYSAIVETRAIVRDTCVRMDARASLEPSKLLRYEGPRERQYNQRPKKLGPPHPRAVVDPEERKTGVLVDVYEAVNKAADAQLEGEAAHESAKKAERSAKKIRQSNRELLE